eukprot:CAMPEP_0205942544 /NCGR_PEP_ID=MMETSP1325-20131115/57892_1 /ASSEMBLY_ACC=CAM_ASM_000708 /TAXON_ID=236786 /ORGANISM="Florenciella sp., Strain RCC1007" /LENGTH=30 /DNA_ID= /DNA_START= /DNA_END= /DNA_ORIENTATION=
MTSAAAFTMVLHWHAHDLPGLQSESQSWVT